MPVEKKKRDNGVGVVDAGARPLAPWSMQAALSLSKEVWEAWGLAATPVKMLWKERLCTICVVPAPKGQMPLHSLFPNNGTCTQGETCRSKLTFTPWMGVGEGSGSAECGHCREPGPGQGAKRLGVGLLLATGAASGDVVRRVY